MNYNQTRVNGIPMPLLMSCTKPSVIETAESEMKMLYDQFLQTVVIDFRTVGTRSLRCSTTAFKTNLGQRTSKTDKKNEIDDQKTV